MIDIVSIVTALRRQKNETNIAGMARFGIKSNGEILGISVVDLRKFSKEIKNNHKKDRVKLHELAEELWRTNIHEARILAVHIDTPELVTKKQMEAWVKDFDSWDVCDSTCIHLFVFTPWAWEKAVKWSMQKSEFVRRAGFTLMAALAVHDKKSLDKEFRQFFPHIKKQSMDGRNFVKKAVNWALRQIGKRSLLLRKEAIKLATEILEIDSPSARWIARDALRELRKATQL